jgi:hypothetical protein
MEIVSVQADCTVSEALALISDRAIVEHRPAYGVAFDVVARRIRFCE